MATLSDAERIGKKLGINFNYIPVETFRYGLIIEGEHDDVTGGDLMTTGKIVRAHLLEAPDYYDRVRIMEKEADKKWPDKKLVRKLVLTETQENKNNNIWSLVGITTLYFLSLVL